MHFGKEIVFGPAEAASFSEATIYLHVEGKMQSVQFLVGNINIISHVVPAMCIYGARIIA